MTEPDGSAPIPNEGVWQRAVRESIDGLAPKEKVPKNRALAVLALKYAAILDANDGDPEVLLDFGPKLQSALVALGCAPAKTAAAPKPASGGESGGNGRATLTLLQGQWGGKTG